MLDRLRGWNRARIARHRLGRGAGQTPFGFRMNGLPAMLDGSFEVQETALVRRLLARCDRFVNVGANTGYYCLFARQAQVPVMALEPVPQTVQILLANLAANGWKDGVTVLPVAAGPAPGMAEIYGVGTGSSLLKGWAGNPESLHQVVPVVRLDDVIASPRPGERVFVLMDVEGYEYPALLGASALIGAVPKPVWMVEIAPDGAGTAKSAHLGETFALFAAAGYEARKAGGDFARVSGPVSGVTNYLFTEKAYDVSGLQS